MTQRIYFVLYLNLALVSGCKQESSWNGAVEVHASKDGGGTVHVRHTYPAQLTATRIIKEDLRIGAVEGNGRDVFSSVTGVAVDKSGSVYVLDHIGQEIRVFDSTGTFKFAFGRLGEGPAEFKSARGLKWSPEGTLWVLDGGNRRLSEFNASGKLIESFRMNSIMRSFFWQGGIDDNGLVYDEGLGYSTGVLAGFVRRFDPRSGVQDSVQLIDDLGEYEVKIEIPRGTMDMPFAPRFHWIVDRNGNIWSTRTNEYAIYRTTFGLDTTLVIEVNNAQLKVTDGEVDEALAVLEPRMDRWSRYTELDRTMLPKVHPFIENIDLDDEGRLWVRRVTRGKNTVFDVFDLEGRYLWSVDAPWSVIDVWHPLIIRNTIYSIVRDSLDVFYVVRGRLVDKR